MTAASLPVPSVSAARRRRLDAPLLLSGAVLAVVLVVALLGGLLVPDVAEGDPGDRLLGFGQSGHLLGTDGQGRDIASRIVAGAGMSLFAGIAPMVIATILGIVLGIVAGMSGRAVHSAVMRTLDVFYAFPAVLLAIAVAAALGQGIGSIVLALTIVLTPPIARVAEVETLRIREFDFIESATASGAGRFMIARTQVLPSILPTLLVYATSLVGLSIIYAAGLSFLGLGVAPPTPEWGLMIDDLRKSIFSRPELVLVPAIAITIVAAAFNVFGNALARRLITGRS